VKIPKESTSDTFYSLGSSFVGGINYFYPDTANEVKVGTPPD